VLEHVSIQISYSYHVGTSFEETPEYFLLKAVSTIAVRTPRIQGNLLVFILSLRCAQLSLSLSLSLSLRTIDKIAFPLFRKGRLSHETKGICLSHIENASSDKWCWVFTPFTQHYCFFFPSFFIYDCLISCWMLLFGFSFFLFLSLSLSLSLSIVWWIFSPPWTINVTLCFQCAESLSGFPTTASNLAFYFFSKRFTNNLGGKVTGQP